MVALNARSFDPGLPEPPYSTDLLADFHAGALDPETHEHVRRRLPADPHAAEVLASLDRVRSDLRRLAESAPGFSTSGDSTPASSTPPMPEAVAARLDSLIDDLTSE